MLKIYNIKEKQEFLREVAILTQKEWGSKTNSEEEFEAKINKKISKIPIRQKRPHLATFYYALSFFLPFARLAFNTFLPDLVDILFMNPCSFCSCLFFG